VVTGGASGIGLAMAQRFAEAQMNVVLADIEEQALSRAVEQFESRQQRVLGVLTDTMRRESIEQLLHDTNREFGNVHILCNNAGVVSGGNAPPVWEISQTDWDWVMGVNFQGVLQGLQTFLPHMVAHGEEGHVVNTASVAAFMPGSGSYGVSKHGVLVLSETLHRDLAAQNAKIGASVLCPGWVNTKIAESERNRPGSHANPANPDGAPLDVGDVLKKGTDPSDIAQVVFESIENNRFYILPHEMWDKVALGRTNAMIERGAPFSIDRVALSEESVKAD